jgi:metal-responsive CopG/Arc/MetJ family transcriptional regulator
VVSISIYCDELQRLDAMVAAAKRNGRSSTNRSSLIRSAIKAFAGERAA